MSQCRMRDEQVEDNRMGEMSNTHDEDNDDASKQRYLVSRCAKVVEVDWTMEDAGND